MSKYVELDRNKSYKEMKKYLIHPWERPTRVINIIIFILLLVLSIALILDPPLYKLFDRYKLADTIVFTISGIIVALVYALGYQYAKTKATSVRLSRNQFPDVYEIIKDCANKMELGYIPEAYLVQEGGSINAFATSFFAKKYISINAAVFEICYLEHKDYTTLSFIIAHEVAHLKRYHATTLMAILEAPAKAIPIYSSAISRVREYTSDRHGAWLYPEGINGVMVLSVGRHLYKNVDVDHYVEDSGKNYKGLFCFLHNLTSSHPVFPKRMKALKNLDKKGKVF